MRNGPSSECATVTTVGPSTLLYYHCYVVNSAGNTWTNVRIAGSNTDGWVSDDELDDHGSLYLC